VRGYIRWIDCRAQGIELGEGERLRVYHNGRSCDQVNGEKCFHAYAKIGGLGHCNEPFFCVFYKQ
jgi:hypothetical protein